MLTTTENNNKTIINIHTINIHENQGKTNGKRNKTAPIIRPKKINKLLQKDDYFVNSLSNIPVQNYSDEISLPNNLRTFALKVRQIQVKAANQTYIIISTILICLHRSIQMIKLNY